MPNYNWVCQACNSSVVAAHENCQRCGCPGKSDARTMNAYKQAYLNGTTLKLQDVPKRSNLFEPFKKHRWKFVIHWIVWIGSVPTFEILVGKFGVNQLLLFFIWLPVFWVASGRATSSSLTREFGFWVVSFWAGFVPLFIALIFFITLANLGIDLRYIEN